MIFFEFMFDVVNIKEIMGVTEDLGGISVVISVTEEFSVKDFLGISVFIFTSGVSFSKVGEVKDNSGFVLFLLCKFSGNNKKSAIWFRQFRNCSNFFLDVIQIDVLADGKKRYRDDVMEVDSGSDNLGRKLV